MRNQLAIWSASHKVGECAAAIHPKLPPRFVSFRHLIHHRISAHPVAVKTPLHMNVFICQQFVNIISINELDIINISLIDNIASISIKIESEQIKYTIDKNDRIIDGNKEVSEIIKDKWVLERDTSSNNPNWKLVETDIVND